MSTPIDTGRIEQCISEYEKSCSDVIAGIARAELAEMKSIIDYYEARFAKMRGKK